MQGLVRQMIADFQEQPDSRFARPRPGNGCFPAAKADNIDTVLDREFNPELRPTALILYHWNPHRPEWWNWQTQGTQNPPGLRAHAGSTPASGTMKIKDLSNLGFLVFFFILPIFGLTVTQTVGRMFPFPFLINILHQDIRCTFEVIRLVVGVPSLSIN
jgi:hypothetical protein